MTPLERLAGIGARPALADVLGDWIPEQRWFAGKAREIVGVRVRDTCLIDGQVLDVLVDIEYADGGFERYQAPLAAASGQGPQVLGAAEGVGLLDAADDAGASLRLARLALADERWPTAGGGHVAGDPVRAEGQDPHPPDQETAVRRMTGEQSNTSMVFADRAILKIFRRLETGVNPDIEITRALTEAGFGHAPAQRGAVTLREASGATTALAVMSDFLAEAEDGWELACADVEAVAAGQREASTPLVAQMADLGRAVAELHVVLAQRFGRRLAGPDDVASWVNSARRQVDAALPMAERRAAGPAAAVLDRADELRSRLSAVLSLDDAGAVTRVHGDLHLGQVLRDPAAGWQLLDFEGEPARSLAERRLLHSPLRDVAGMLRSFDYASAPERIGDAAVGRGGGQAAAAWRDASRRRFLDGYLHTAENGGVLPSSPTQTGILVEAFELDKAVYELAYELANRPSWLPIPLGGIVRVLDGDAGTPL